MIHNAHVVKSLLEKLHYSYRTMDELEYFYWKTLFMEEGSTTYTHLELQKIEKELIPF